MFVRGEVDGQQVKVVVEQRENEHHPQRGVSHEHGHQPGQGRTSVHVQRSDLPQRASYHMHEEEQDEVFIIILSETIPDKWTVGR